MEGTDSQRQGGQPGAPICVIGRERERARESERDDGQHNTTIVLNSGPSELSEAQDNISPHSAIKNGTQSSSDLSTAVKPDDNANGSQQRIRARSPRITQTPTHPIPSSQAPTFGPYLPYAPTRQLSTEEPKPARIILIPHWLSNPLGPPALLCLAILYYAMLYYAILYYILFVAVFVCADLLAVCVCV